MFNLSFYLMFLLFMFVNSVDKRFPDYKEKSLDFNSEIFCNNDEKCIDILNCPTAIRNWKRFRKFPRTCSQEETSFICCKEEEEDHQLESSKSNKCLEIYRKRYKRDLNEPSIKPKSSNHDVSVVGGENAELKEFPYMAALGWEKGTSKDDFFCGGVLINPLFVLTAAHCTSFNGEPPTFIRIGGRNLIGKNTEDIFPENIIVHPEYDPYVAYHDIALIKLKSNSKFLPACLWSHSAPVSEGLVAIGYGHTQFAGENSDILQKVTITISENSECQKIYGGTPNNPHGIIRSQICAGDYEGNRDTCQGDSGGPLLKILEIEGLKIPQVVGITSMGSACAGGTPSIYTRVSEYIDWIYDSMV